MTSLYAAFNILTGEVIGRITEPSVIIDKQDTTSLAGTDRGKEGL